MAAMAAEGAEPSPGPWQPGGAFAARRHPGPGSTSSDTPRSGEHHHRCIRKFSAASCETRKLEEAAGLLVAVGRPGASLSMHPRVAVFGTAVQGPRLRLAAGRPSPAQLPCTR